MRQNLLKDFKINILTTNVPSYRNQSFLNQTDSFLYDKNIVREKVKRQIRNKQRFM